MSQALQDLQTVADLIRAPYNDFKLWASEGVSGDLTLNVGGATLLDYHVPRGQALIITRMECFWSELIGEAANSVLSFKSVAPRVLYSGLSGYFTAQGKPNVKTTTHLGAYMGAQLTLFAPDNDVKFRVQCGSSADNSHLFALAIRFEGLLTLPQYISRLQPMQTVIHS